MADFRCNVIPEPAPGTRSILKQNGPTFAYFVGDGPDSYLCESCGFVLARNVTMEYIRRQIHTADELGIVLQCAGCKSFNEFGPDLG
jgi:hypothetical protein